MNGIIPQENNTPGVPNKKGIFSISSERTLLIMGMAGLLALLMLIGVLVFEIIEFHFYRQPPSSWPSKIQSK